MIKRKAVTKSRGCVNKNNDNDNNIVNVLRVTVATMVITRKVLNMPLYHIRNMTHDIYTVDNDHLLYSYIRIKLIAALNQSYANKINIKI